MLRKKSLLFAMLLGIFVVAGCSQEPAISETGRGRRNKKSESGGSGNEANGRRNFG